MQGFFFCLQPPSFWLKRLTFCTVNLTTGQDQLQGELESVTGRIFNSSAWKRIFYQKAKYSYRKERLSTKVVAEVTQKLFQIKR